MKCLLGSDFRDYHCGGVQAACINQKCRQSKAGNFRFVDLGTPDARVAPNSGDVDMWHDPDAVLYPDYEAIICTVMRSNNPETDEQYCMSFEDHHVEKWDLNGFTDTCSNIATAEYRVADNGTIFGLQPLSNVRYCECHDDD